MRKTPVIAALLFATGVWAQTPAQNPTDFLAAIATAIEHRGGACPGLYKYTYANSLPPEGWLMQTPFIWGKKPADIVAGNHSTFLPKAMGDLIATAQKVVDITTLGPAPDGRWEQEIIRGLRAVADSGRPVIVRILVANPTGFGFDAKAYLARLGAELEKSKGKNLIVYAAGHHSEATSWNHSKIVQVDGRYALTGGHNQWDADYLGSRPVHDVSMLVEGQAAYAAFNFANVMWDYIRDCNSTRPCTFAQESYRWTPGHIIREAPPGITVDIPPATGDVPIIAVARAGVALIFCDKDAQPSDTAMLAVFDHAQKSIRLSQQDIALSLCGSPTRQWWDDGMKALARAVARNVDVQMVLSNYKAKGGTGNPYSSCVGSSEVWTALLNELRKVAGLPEPALVKLMKEKVHIATLRFGPDPADTWLNGWPFANHAKVLIVDDSVFYIGSSNFYSSDLQEFGYFVQRPAAVQTLLADYWDPMWKYSKVTEYVP